jgi:predicted acylesterase/phospholipase RssA
VVFVVVPSRINSQVSRSIAPSNTTPSSQRGDEETIALAISGGISLGSYKAGVNWFLLEANKRLSDPSYQARMRSLAQPYLSNPPAVKLGAITGASAGNINAIASAISWCRRLPGVTALGTADRVDSAENSLLWKLWVPTGFQEMQPPEPSVIDATEASLLVRHFFESDLLPHLRDAMRDPVLKNGCRVPVGVTLTSITPDTLRAGPILAPVQRHSVLAEFLVPLNASAAGFRIAPEALRSLAMGSLIFPAPVRDSVIATDAIFSVVKASSAFPIGFAPVEIRYFRYRDLKTGSSCPPDPVAPCAKPHLGMFSDGGVFDNLPISLTVELMRRNAGIVTDASRPTLHVMPIDPHSTNDASAGGQLVDVPDEPRTGLSAVARLLRNAVPSARAYELQMFTRSLDRESQRRASDVPRENQLSDSSLVLNGTCPDTNAPDSLSLHVCISAATIRLSGSTRSFPLMGERMRAFGAFFGRPLRQYDFYLGVFDGLRQFARASLCRESASQLAAHDCETTVVRNVLLTDALQRELGLSVSPIGWTILRLAARAAGQLDPTEGSVEPATAFRGDARIVYELSRIRDAALRTPLLRACPRRHWVDAILCDRDYIGMLHALNTALGDDIKALHADNRGALAGADSVLLRAVADPERFADQLYTRLLWRQDRIERWLGTRQDREGEGTAPRTPSFEQPVALLEALYLSGNERYRSGYNAFPSSIPTDDRNPATWLARGAPYYFGAGILMDVVTFGYRPTLYFRRGKSSYSNAAIRLGAAVPAIDVFRLDTRRSGGRFRGVAWHTSVGPGLVVLIPKTSVSALEIAGGYVVGPSGGQADWQGRLSVDISARLIANKFRVSVRRQPDYLWKPPGPRSIRGIIGVVAVNDVPGITYWTYRLLRAH